ncbi:hypothetical protein FSARC_10724 [Fusarium sarcochroum]|uniref:Uncharacterized protein n=1 Tax=Fusarium sarcochroum TaxID=1208366 RepID=A0A8H4X399_9HYPO|nr:hypothetical protein FSARC_10724 [Fusarium sarcochroum]
MNSQMVSASDDVFSDNIAYGCSQPSGNPGALHPIEFVARARAAPLVPRRPAEGTLPCGCCGLPTPSPPAGEVQEPPNQIPPMTSEEESYRARDAPCERDLKHGGRLVLPPARELFANSSYHKHLLEAEPGGIWDESRTVQAIFVANLPNLDLYEGSMADGRRALFGKMQDLKNIFIDDRDRRYTPRQAELAVIQHLKIVFGMAGEGDEHMTFWEQECARLNFVVKWLSSICLFSDTNGPMWENMRKNQEEQAERREKERRRYLMFDILLN